MFYYIPQIIFFVALAIIIWLAVKNLPKARKLDVSEMIGNIGDDLEEFTVGGKKIFKNIHIEEVDAKVNSLLEKVLRKLKINTIKFDHQLQRAIDSIKSKSKPKQKSKAIFDPEKELNENNDSEKENIKEEEVDSIINDLELEAKQDIDIKKPEIKTRKKRIKKEEKREEKQEEKLPE